MSKDCRFYKALFSLILDRGTIAAFTAFAVIVLSTLIIECSQEKIESNYETSLICQTAIYQSSKGSQIHIFWNEGYDFPLDEIFYIDTIKFERIHLIDECE